MGIFSRFTDIINANINSLLDKAEDPEKMVRLIIQEMEDTLVEVRSASAKTLLNKKELSQQIGKLQQEANEWHAKAELALSKEREDLARAALLEKQKCLDSSAELEREFGLVEEQIAKLQEEVAQLQEKLADAKNRQKTILMRQSTANSRLEVKKRLDKFDTSNAIGRFEQYERKIDSLESQIESFDLGKQSLSKQFAELEENRKVEDELESLKKKIQTGNQSSSDN